MKSPALIISFFGFAALAAAALAKEPVDYIDPLVGTGHFGKTYPGPSTPGGMVQLSPDSITGGDNASGYRYRDKTLQGFSLARMSGVGWYGDLGNFLVMPTVGPLKTYYGQTDKPGTGYLSPIEKSSEKVSAGYYAVTFEDSIIRAELTAAAHSAILRFTFPENPQSRIQIDLARRIGGTSLRQTVKVMDDRAIEGEIECAPAGGGRGHGAGGIHYTLHYHAEFSVPLMNVGVWSAKLPEGPYNDILEKPEFMEACRNAEILPGCREKEGQHLGFFAEFATKADDLVLFKVGISFVSVAGARENLRAEIPGFDFDKVHQEARQAWAKALNRVRIEGGSEEQRGAFYTSLYHALKEPQILGDLSGEYPGGDGKIHTAKAFTKRTTFAGWDVYRSEFPLLSLLSPSVVSDMINSMIELATQNGRGYFDRWEFLNCYQGNMNGNPAVIAINDAYQKGIRNFDSEKAFQYAVNTCERSGNGERGYTVDSNYSLSKTLEYANADWNLAQLAAKLGKTEEAKKYEARSKAWRNLYDPDVPWTYRKDGRESRPEWKGWFHSRDKSGQWLPWEGLASGAGCQEATVYQQGWFVPQDIPGLIELLGGKELFVGKLTDFFERTPDVSAWSGPNRKGSNEVLTPYYNHPNEPVHLIPFLFNRAGSPWLTQKWVRRIDAAYKTGPEGLCGDEDNGQMSSWFVLAASGLHQACPGDTRYEIFSPLFDKIVIRLDPHFSKGGAFTITAKNNSPENIYIQSASLNGRPLQRCWLSHQEIVEGGRLDLVLGAQPNLKWGME